MKANVYFSKIRDEIILNLKKAKKSIKIAVAWFTDEDIIRALCQVKAKGVEVEAAISSSKENFINPNNFKDYLRLQAKLFIVTSTFLHHKFCIIDNDIIISGSYNWSYAARSNEENILVLSLSSESKEDEDFLKRFNIKHKFLCEKCSIRINDVDSLRKFRNNSENFANIQSQQDEDEIKLRRDFENNIQENIGKSLAAGISLTPNLLERMAADGGGVDFVKRLLHDEMNSGDLKPGLKKLVEHIPHRVDLSFEYLVTRPKFNRLFSIKEIEFCKRLMAKYGL